MVKPSPMQDKLVEFVRDNPNCSKRAAVIAVWGLPVMNGFRALDSAVRNGKILAEHRQGRGYRGHYRLRLNGPVSA